MKSILTLAFAVAMIAGSAGAVPKCDKGQLCGNACISRAAVCHKPMPPQRNCGAGKLCGKTCIAKTATCHKTASNDFGLSGPYAGLKYVGDSGGAH